MRKLLALLVLLLVGCNTVIIGTPTNVPATLTPTVTRTAISEPTATDVGQKFTLTPESTQESTPTQEVWEEPTAFPTHEIYIYRPADTPEADDFIQVVANRVNVRVGSSFDSACFLPPNGLDYECEDENRELLYKDDVRKVYIIYYDATLDQYWARINPETDLIPRWVSVNTLICRNAPNQPIILCTEFK
jgi:hypothetical protein